MFIRQTEWRQSDLHPNSSESYICIGTLCEVLPALRLGRRVIASERDQRVWAEGMKILRTEVKVDSSQ